MVRAVRFERTITSTQNWWINQTFPRPHILWKRVWDSNPRKTLLMPLPVFKTGVFNHSTNPPIFLAGVAGLEPANTAVKVLCLTTWRHPSIKGGTPYWSISTKLYESQKGLCEDRSLIFSTKHFVPDLRLAKYYSQHIRSMVTTNLSNGERPQGFSPPLMWYSFNTLYPAILLTIQDSFYL